MSSAAIRVRLFGFAVAAACALGAPQPWATLGSAEPRQAFIDHHLCEIATRLTVIRDVEAVKNKFISLSPAGDRGSYVQCIFIDDDRAMWCEAASGAYRVRKGEPWSPVVTPEGRQALSRLGFETAIEEGNYGQRLDIGDGTDLAPVAILMLAALYDAYGVRLGVDLNVRAPFTDIEGRLPASCSPAM